MWMGGPLGPAGAIPDAQLQASPPNATAPARFHQDPIAEAEYRNPSRVPGNAERWPSASEGETAGLTGLKKPCAVTLNTRLC